ncbi:MAG: class I SAM-dependent methyltransferase [Planctomycetota bacterium]|jgi:SAM-dependent methyltransferase
MSQRDAIAHNIAAHDRIAGHYEAIHTEIFNPVEQARLRASLERARGLLRTGSATPRALDFGCGTGNVSDHLDALGFRVTAADVSTRFLDMLRDRFTTFRLNGADLAGLDDGAFDFVASYSVLHHIPDYLAAVRELARVTKPGGVVYIDHEASPRLWERREEHRRFRRRARFDKAPWRRLVRSVRKRFGLHGKGDGGDEGDIHVSADDHIEWERIGQALATFGFEAAWTSDYLLFDTRYDRSVYEEHADRLADCRCTAYVAAGGI